MLMHSRSSCCSSVTCTATAESGTSSRTAARALRAHASRRRAMHVCSDACMCIHRREPGARLKARSCTEYTQPYEYICTYTRSGSSPGYSAIYIKTYVHIPGAELPPATWQYIHIYIHIPGADLPPAARRRHGALLADIMLVPRPSLQGHHGVQRA